MESKFQKILVFTLLFLLLNFPAFSQIKNEFNEPWKNQEVAIVIDAYHGNSINWHELKKDKRVVGILHKATEGITFVDSKYDKRKLIAKEKGYKWGSYHLLRKGDTVEQAKAYLKKIDKNSSDEIMALDVECTENSLCNIPKYKVSAKEIKTFLKFIKKETGRHPIFYGNQSVIKDLSSKYPNDELLFKSPLWYARFRKNVPDFPNQIWKTYTFWQFSSEINCKTTGKCLYNVPGTLFDMDVNVYNGTVKELIENWSKIGQ